MGAGKAELLREAARLAESRANHRNAAFTALARAMPLAPDDWAIESDARRLAGETGDHLGLARAVAEAIAVLPAGSRWWVELLTLRASVCESHLEDGPGPLAAFREALEAEPGRLDHDGR